VANAGIEVEGLREFLKGLRKVEPELDKTLKAELKDVAQPIAADARSRIKSKRAAATIRAGADAKGPYIAGGKSALPWYGWFDFGSRNPRSGQPRRVGPWTSSGAGPKGGRGIYPAIAAHNDDIIKGAERALDNARNAAGLGDE
jgi:hypothetical protein